MSKKHFCKKCSNEKFGVRTRLHVPHTCGKENNDLDYDDEIELPDTCPNCGTAYDGVDMEYQICHICKFNNNK